MSETLSQDPDGLGAVYTTLVPTYPPTPATPSSTVQDAPSGAHLPPFSTTFTSDVDSGSTFSSMPDRLFSDSRLLDISNWDYYTEARLLDRSDSSLAIISSQPQYRPWESKSVDTSTSSYTSTTPATSVADAFSPTANTASKLPSFQSQFQAFSEVVTTSDTTLTTLTNLTPVSPNSSSPQTHLTTLNSNFHALSAVNPRNYPLVPAPIQAREIPSIQQQFLDERHIQLYSHPAPTNITLNSTLHPTFLNSQNGAIIQNNQLLSSPTVVTVIKSEPDLKMSPLHQDSLKIQNIGLHPTQFQNPMTQLNSDSGLYNGIEKKINGNSTSPTRNDFRKKERRKIRTSSLESSVDSDGTSSTMDICSENSGQVAAISSTAGFKSHQMHANSSVDMDTDISGGSVDKQVKKKRKRCGECVGCQRKDNCGDCAPCRNDKSHQICKQRRCEKLTEKKNLYQDGFLRGESRRGRGKGRGGSSYRGRKPTVAPLGGGGNTIPENGGGTSTLVPQSQSVRPSPQPLPVQQPMPVQQQPMGTMPFYADPNRFSTPVWQTDPSQGWTQSQFIQQIPAAASQPIEAYQQYPNGIYQATYQQPAFEANTFYTTGPVQVLANPRPPSTPNSQVQQLGPPRPNSNYSHTPSPSPAQQQQQNNNGRQYQEYNISQQQITQQQNESTQANSRPGSVNNGNPPTPNSNYQTQQPQTPASQQQSPQQQSQMSNSAFTTIANFSPNSSASYVSAGSGNAQPGYPQVNSNSPRLASHSSSGYSGQEQFSGQENTDWRNDGQIMWDEQKPDQQTQHYDTQQDSNKPELNNSEQPESRTFSQADKVNLNTRIKTMILNKQQENKDESKQVEQNTAGHFLWYSHHHHLTHRLSDDGGTLHTKFTGLDRIPSMNRNSQSPNVNIIQRPRDFEHKGETVKEEYLTNSATMNDFAPQMHYTDLSANSTAQKSIGYYGDHTVKSEVCKEQTEVGKTTSEIKTINPTSNMNYVVTDRPSVTDKSKLPSDIHSFNGGATGSWPKPFPDPMVESPITNPTQNAFQAKDISMLTERLSKKQIGMEIPDCTCFPPNQVPPEPGTYYTHLGCANDLKSLRYDLECRTGFLGKAIRIEKIKYTGKEGKTAQGCPIAKWVIRRQNLDEKYLVLVKQRKGHVCYSSFIVVCMVVWDGVERGNADDLYTMLTEKLNKYGVPTKRRCATNEPRTCACQGIDETTCGASFSFGCSWSMYYNGCKFTRSKEVRKFRLTDKGEEAIIEDKLQQLADIISPLYKSLAPKSFQNQVNFENIAPQCRLGLKSGRPFSGVTACVDFCAHAHKDLHNMTNGCTVVVSLTKHRSLSKAPDEQLHVLPLYVADDTDEFGSKENQELKVKNGCIEILQKYPCEVRTCSVPAETCLRRNKKSQEPGKPGRKRKTTTQSSSPAKASTNESSSVDEIQNGQVSSTVPGYPKPHWGYDNSLNIDNSSMYYFKNDMGNCDGYQPANNLPRFSFFKTPFSTMNTFNYPAHNNFIKNEFYYNDWNANFYHPPNLATPNMNQYASQFSNCPSYHTGNPFDDVYTNNFLQTPPTPPMTVPPTHPPSQQPDIKQKVVNVTHTDNIECFQDNQIGGVAIALQHGSILFECAKHELHATTALQNPNRLSPTRISLVFYQHRNLNKAYHGLNEYTEKAKHKSENADSPDKLSSDYKYDVGSVASSYDVLMRTSTLPTVSLTTRFPMFPCMITGPFQEQKS